MPDHYYLLEASGATLERLRERKPLVHCLTNQVVKPFTANALLALGAAPAMIEHPAEAAQFAGVADALLVNLGTLDELQAEAIRQAVPAAVAAGRPWVLDPVAVGLLSVRTSLAHELVRRQPALIRGNASEILALNGEDAHGQGVDSGDSAETALSAARELALETGAVVLVTGAVDVLTDGKQVARCANGHPLLTRITGVGCAQGAIAAACAAVSDTPWIAAATAALIMGLAGERAALRSLRPGSFQPALLDALDELAPEDLATQGRLL